MASSIGNNFTWTQARATKNFTLAILESTPNCSFVDSSTVALLIYGPETSYISFDILTSS